MTKTRCCSVRYDNDLSRQCLFYAKEGDKYCSLHLLQKNKIDYHNQNNEIIQTHSVTKHINLLEKKDIIKDNKVKKSNKPAPFIIRENKTECEKELLIANIILMNEFHHNKEFADKIGKLIGPMFDGMACCEDAFDPITYDSLFIHKNNPSAEPNFMIFSYENTDGKIRCMNFSTAYDVLHSRKDIRLTCDLQPKDKETYARLNDLVALYKIIVPNIFTILDHQLHPIFLLYTKLSTLFKKFHMFGIYLEERRFLRIKTKSKLLNLIVYSRSLINNSNDPKLINLKLFQNVPIENGGRDNSINNWMKLKEYIIDQWILIASADNYTNQMHIWKIVAGLCHIDKKIKNQFPNLDIGNNQPETTIIPRLNTIPAEQ
jgi:hypothetical protein